MIQFANPYTIRLNFSPLPTDKFVPMLKNVLVASICNKMN